MRSCCIPWFDSETSLNQHRRTSLAHAFNCMTCNRRFDSEEALQQHLRDSPIHQHDTETPFDVFFGSCLRLDYDPSLPRATSFSARRDGRCYKFRVPVPVREHFLDVVGKWYSTVRDRILSGG